METTQLIEKTTQKVLRRAEHVRNELQQKPKGILSEEMHDGKAYFVRTYYENGKRIRQGISRNRDLINELVQKEILNKEIESLQSEIDTLHLLADKIVDFDVITVINEMIKRCPHLSQERIIEAIRDTKADEWASAVYPKSNYKRDELKQITSRGLKVRSKSELLITEKLYEYDLSMRYEQILQIGNITLVPDFTIKRKDGKIFYWEHEGLTNVQSYLDWQIKKAQLYASVGIVPWDNLIITYDNTDGIIDLRIVESEIRNKLLI